jgi:iron-sulfur cluster assembly protein
MVELKQSEEAGRAVAGRTDAGQSAAGESVSQDSFPIEVTPKAIAKVREIFAKHGVKGGLRLGVLGGGCSGLSYQFKFDAKERARDHVKQFDDVKIFVDPKSMIYLKGMTLDYKESLMQSGFAFENPNAKKACGCGTSFTA